MARQLRLVVASTVVALTLGFTGAAQAALLVGTTVITASPDASIPVGTTATITMIVGGTNLLAGSGLYEPSRGYYMGTMYVDVLGLQYFSTLNIFVNCWEDDKCWVPISTGTVSNVVANWNGPHFPASSTPFLEPIGPPQGYVIGSADRNSPNLPLPLLSPGINIPYRNVVTGEQAWLRAPQTQTRLVPEASQLALLGTGLAGLLRLARRRPS